MEELISTTFLAKSKIGCLLFQLFIAQRIALGAILDSGFKGLAEAFIQATGLLAQEHAVFCCKDKQNKMSIYNYMCLPSQPFSN